MPESDHCELDKAGQVVPGRDCPPCCTKQELEELKAGCLYNEGKCAAVQAVLL